MIHSWVSRSIRAASPPSHTLCRQCLQSGKRRQSAPVRLLFAHSSPRNLQTFHTEASTSDTVPLRKQLKDEAKKRRAAGESKSEKKRGKSKDPRLEKWDLTVGIEIHAQLNTECKLFSSAAASNNDSPNSHVALFDVAFPGTQPVFQKEALIPALRAATALHCNIQRTSRFDRKHYFYQDQPAGYQITQYYEPFARDGRITLYAHDGIAPEDGDSITIGIKQIQMEQDTAKSLLQPPQTHLLDFNRVGHPLIEIITLPQIHHPQTAAACVRKIQAMLQAVNAVTIGMEMGGLRADVNVSVRLKDQARQDDGGHEYYGVKGLGQRTEIKNLSSFKAVEDAIMAERDRQIDALEGGGMVEGETRGWALGSTETTRLRGKEGEVDYRYMPDPDLGPVIIGKDVLDHIIHTLPIVPDMTLEVLTMEPYCLTIKDAKTIMSLDDGARLDYYLEVMDDAAIHTMGSDRQDKDSSNPKSESTTTATGKTAGNWLLHELGGLFTTSEKAWDKNTVPANQLALIVVCLLQKKITGRTAKQLLAMKFEGDRRDVNEIIDQDMLMLVPMAKEDYVTLALGLIDQNDHIVRQIRDKGQVGKIQWFVGQMMRNGEEGRIEAEKAEAVLKELLGVTSYGI